MKPAPTRIPNYLKKAEYIICRQLGHCAIAWAYHKRADITELHHAGVHNTKVNRKKYPLLIHSLWNLMGVNHKWHMEHPYFGRIHYQQADRREAFLQRHPMIAAGLNCEEYQSVK